MKRPDEPVASSKVLNTFRVQHLHNFKDPVSLTFYL